MATRRRNLSRTESARRANLLLAGGAGGLLLFVVVLLSVLAFAQPKARPADTPSVAADLPVASPAATPRAPVAAASEAPATGSKAVPAKKPAPRKASAAKKPAPPKTLPEHMARVPDGAGQLIVVTGARIGANSGTLAVYDLEDGHWAQVLSTSAHFGKNGLVDGKTRKQGHLQTPTGIWRIGGFLFGQHASAPSGTRMAYRHITGDAWWSSEANSTYNTWVRSSSPIDGEHLADSAVQYEYAFDSGYNAPPNERVIGRGTAIFIHCAEPPGNALGPYTHGCVAIDPRVMKRLFTILDPARNPCCAIGTPQKGSATSIWAY